MFTWIADARANTAFRYRWISKRSSSANRQCAAAAGQAGRIRRLDDGNAFDIEWTMTDPQNWEGEWKNTKRFVRRDRVDIEEHVCIYEQMRDLPSFRGNIRG